MGYSHYWRHGRDITDQEWSVFRKDFLKLAAAAPMPLSDFEEENEIDPSNLEDLFNYEEEAKTRSLAFNGLGDDAYEWFYLTQKMHLGFYFCKTARKPYDLLVCATLALLQDVAPSAYNISSDGDWREDEWQPAVQFAADTLQRRMVCPISGRAVEPCNPHAQAQISAVCGEMQGIEGPDFYF